MMAEDSRTTSPRPNRLRFSLRGLFAVVTVAAIGSAALTNPTDLWASVMFSGTVVLLVVALLVVVARRGSARVGAIGFALCGCAYLGLIIAPGAVTNIVPNLVTSRVLSEAQSKWHPSQSAVSSIAWSQSGVTGSVTGTVVWNTASGQILVPGVTAWQTTPFQRIGHSLFALLFAIVGSVVARWMDRGSDKSEEKLTPPEAGTPS